MAALQPPNPEISLMNELLSEKLQIDVGDFVYHIIRLRFLDKVPHLIDITYILLMHWPEHQLSGIAQALSIPSGRYTLWLCHVS